MCFWGANPFSSIRTLKTYSMTSGSTFGLAGLREVVLPLSGSLIVSFVLFRFIFFFIFHCFSFSFLFFIVFIFFSLFSLFLFFFSFPFLFLGQLLAPERLLV